MRLDGLFKALCFFINWVVMMAGAGSLQQHFPHADPVNSGLPGHHQVKYIQPAIAACMPQYKIIYQTR